MHLFLTTNLEFVEHHQPNSNPSFGHQELIVVPTTIINSSLIEDRTSILKIQKKKRRTYTYLFFYIMQQDFFDLAELQVTTKGTNKNNKNVNGQQLYDLSL
ncbi:hypothetical protein JHK82_026777 [Glycine max]|uniref:Uncharacterized protein n=2 Tax=Glycine subgen. Soja TaxID=1462606 RepID=A0A0R0HTQ5_SOYBN|nr:hypothetical protein JHK87_026658 [Glycine soja]KAG4995956.1 hypothetical protein JHK85_027395 [Glycine max]KAG5002761.1 hypothetical protein JHK86_026900 [Glycine max]KAG5125942.1 hypothetical protein JHK82_026777 [Glycine max]KAG5150534.1 hypothetical protein JHK84_027006 [Glycine max]